MYYALNRMQAARTNRKATEPRLVRQPVHD